MAMGIKLDTTGFQMMKTPEQEALEAQESEQRALVQNEEIQLNQAELQQRQIQGDAVITALSSIAQQVNQLNSNVAKPIIVQRDEAGNITGAV